MNGTKRADSRRATAAALARSLGVSTAAVSYAFNGKPGVSDEMRSRILQAAKESGIEIPERALRHASIQLVIGLVLADLGNPFYQKLGLAVVDAARMFQYEAYLAHTGDNPEELITTVRAMASHNVDGIILTATQDGDARVAMELRRSSIPYVQVSRKMPTVRAGFVGIDNEAAARDMAKHVAGHGYKKIALAIGPRRSSASNERHAGYLHGLIESAISVPQRWIVRTDLGIEGGTKAAKYFRELACGLPEAIICGSDAIATGLIREFEKHHISVPGDVAVTGFDGVFPVSISGLSLTTVVQPVKEMARKSVEYLDGIIRHKRSETVETICKYKLRIGNTCGCDYKKGE